MGYRQAAVLSSVCFFLGAFGSAQCEYIRNSTEAAVYRSALHMHERRLQGAVPAADRRDHSGRHGVLHDVLLRSSSDQGRFTFLR